MQSSKTKRIPKPSGHSDLAIGRIAEDLRRESNIHSGFDLLEFIKINRGSVEEIDPDSLNQKDGLIILPDGSFTVRLSTLSSGLRNNFIMAHEIGHYFLHWMYKGIHEEMRFPRSREGQNEDMMTCEVEADNFALSFLMPATEFTELYQEGGLDAVSDKFAVTHAVAGQRVERLEIKTQARP